MKWSSSAWESARPIYEKTLAHPFIQELMLGTLSRERFEFYIQQDALYLAEFGKMMAGLASKLENPQHIQSFLRFAMDTVEVEKALHATFREQFNLSGHLEPTPACLLYTSYMHSCLHTKSLPEALAAALPCFWVYMKVGDYILEHQTKNYNPYQQWIDTYAGDEFASAVNTAIAICDEVAEKCTSEQQEKMTQAFVLVTKMEWMFWDSAYALQKWEI